MPNAAYYAANKAKLDAYNKAWRAANPKYNAQWYADHKEEQATRHAANQEMEATRNKAWRAAHPEASRAKSARMRALYPEKAAARLRVMAEVRYGRWPAANMQVCEICGEAQAEEYHHYLGYEPEHWLHAQAVCRECHRTAHK